MISHTKKLLASVGSFALVAGGMMVMATAPAQAATGTLNYTCQTSLGERTFTAVVATDLPATMVEGESFTPTVSATVNVPQSVTNSLYFFGWNNAQGTAVATSLVDGVSIDVDLAFPVTPYNNSDTPLVIQASGIADAPIVAGAAGTSIVVEASDFTTSVQFGKADDPSAVTNQSPSCVLDEGQNAIVNTVQVVAEGGGDENGDGDGGGDNGGENGGGDNEIELEFTAPDSAYAGDDIDLEFMEEAIGETFDFEIHSVPASLGTHTVGADGRVTLTIPSTVPAGEHTIVVFVGDDAVAAAPITILAADDVADDAADDADDADEDAQALERTGGSTYLLAVLGGLALLGGGAAFGLRRRFADNV